jgi:hypothetical protein
MTTTPKLVKLPTQVNTSDAPAHFGGSFTQDGGHITALQDGGYVVVWTDGSRTHNIDGNAVVAQRYDSAGNQVGGEVKISPFNNGSQDSPAVTTLSNGNIAVALVDILHGHYDIYVRIYDPSLGLVRTDAIDTGPGETVDPSITALAGGGYAITYTLQNSFDDTDIVARIVSPTGTIGSQFDVDNQTDNRNFSDVATLANGNVVVVYEDEFNGSTTNHDVRYAIFGPSGGHPLIGPTPVINADNGFQQTDPDVAALPSGAFVVAWTDQVSGGTTDIRASIYKNGGGSATILVNTTTAGNQNEANVVALADGDFLVTWEDDSADVVRAQRFDGVGNKVGNEFIVNVGVEEWLDTSPEAALLANGRIAYALPDGSTGDLDVTTSIWTTSGPDAVGAVGAMVAGDFNSTGAQEYIWRDASAVMTKWEYSATAQQVAQVDLGTVGFSWKILASDHFSNATPDQMLTQNVVDGTMTLWWVNDEQQLTGANIGQNWNGIDYIANGQFTDIGGAGVADFLVTNTGDHHLYDWWIDSNYKLQGIDLGAAWSNISFVGTGEFTPNGKTDFLVSNTVDHHLYDWWIDPASGTLQGLDLGAAWNNVGYIASGKFTANGGGDNLLVFNQTDHHLYDWWIDAASGTLGGVDLGAHWSNVEFLASGHFDNHTPNAEILVRNTVDNHLYEWWIEPTSQALTGIDLGAHPGIEFIDSGHFNNANGSTIDDEFLVHNTADGHLYEWWIANSQLSGANLIV